MRNVLKLMKKQFSDFCDFYFSSYHENWQFSEQKWRKVTITWKIKSEIFYIQSIHHLESQAILERLRKKNNFWNLHGRSEIGSIERKTNFQIFIFRIMVILVSFLWKKSPQFLMITRKIKIGEFFYYFSRSTQNTPHHS